MAPDRLTVLTKPTLRDVHDPLVFVPHGRELVPVGPVKVSVCGYSGREGVRLQRSILTLITPSVAECARMLSTGPPSVSPLYLMGCVATA